MSIDPLSIGRIMNSQLSTPQRQEIASQEFEGYLVEMMIKEMRKTVPEGFFSSPAMDMFTEMLDQVLAKELAESGSLGFAEKILRDFSHETADDNLPAEFRGFPVRKENSPIMKEIRERMDGVASAAALQQRMQNKDNVLFQEAERFTQNQKIIAPIDLSSLYSSVSSEYGMRKHPISGEWAMHDGLDIAAPAGTKIASILAGTVVFAGEQKGYGNTVIVEHGNGRRSLYAHCQSIDVHKGQIVQAGQQIATVGSTGTATGSHLHLELQLHGEKLDPMNILQAEHMD